MQTLMCTLFLKNAPKFCSLMPNQTKLLEPFYGHFHRPLALFIHHYTQLRSAVQVRSLQYSSWVINQINRTYLYKGVHITNVLVIIVNKCSLFDKQHKQLIAPRTLSNFCGESRRPFMTPVQSKRVRSVHGTIIFMHQRFHEIFF